MKISITGKEKQAAIEAAREGAQKAYEKSKSKPGLPWWKKLIWVVLAGAAAAASYLLSGCTQMYAWDELTPSQQQTLQAADHAYHQWSGQAMPGVVTVAEGGK